MWKRAGIAALGMVVLCLGLSIAAAQQTGGEMPPAAAPLLPTGRRGAHRVDDRRVISGIMHMLKTGGRWCDCPDLRPQSPPA